MSDSSSPQYEPTHPMHYHPGIHFRGTEHASHNPHVRIVPRTKVEQEREIEQDGEKFDQLFREHKMDVDANPLPSSSPSSSSSSSTTPDVGTSSEKVFDPSTLEFLEKASTTLSTVMQHDSHAIFHFKSLLAHAKSELIARRYDRASTLFQEASNFYLTKLRQPYEKIATTKALGKTIEERMAKQLEQERADGTSGSSSSANTAAQQFREKELQNQPHVHTAFIEYQMTLKKTKNAHVEKRAAAAAAAAAAASPSSDNKPAQRRR